MWKSTVLKNTTDSYKKNISNMIYKHLRSTGTHEAVKGLSVLISIRLQNDVQNFDVRWDQALQGVALIGAVFFQKMAVTVALNGAVSLPVRRLVASNSACTHFL